MSPANRRTYYAIEEVGIVPIGTTSVDQSGVVRGLQNIGSNLNFNTEFVLEIGQIDTYTAMENRPDTTFNMEKVFDGYPLIWHMATRAAASAGTSATSGAVKDLAARSEYQSMLYMSIYPDTATNTTQASSVSTLITSGAYVTSLEYNLQKDGNFTESVNFTANDRYWAPAASTETYFAWTFSGADAPGTADTGVYRRWDFDFTNSRFPKDIAGVNQTTNKNDYDSGDATAGYAHIQSARVSTSLTREDIYELGRKAPYYRYAKFPVDVTCAFELASAAGDQKNAYAEAVNLQNQIIDLFIGAEGHKVRLYLGGKNKLTSIDYSGGSVDGAILAQTYNYSNQNTLTISADTDFFPLNGTSVYNAV